MSYGGGFNPTVTQDRADIYEILQGIPGVKAFPDQPPASAMVVGAAWPVWGGFQRSNGYWMVTWRVAVIVGASSDVSDEYASTLTPLIVTALEPFAYVDLARPTAFPIGGTEKAAVEIRMEKEAG